MPGKKQALIEEIAEWKTEVDNYRSVESNVATIERLRATDIPQFEKEEALQQARYTSLTPAVDAAKEKVDNLKGEIQEIQLLKRTAYEVTRTMNEIKAYQSDVERIEGELASTGSTETADSVQAKLDKVNENLCVYWSCLLC